MSVEVVLDTPLAQALNSVIQPKLVDVGWSTGGTENDLSEYIILMLVNGKTQEQIAAELSGDLLNLEPDNPDARNFSRWLFDQVDLLNSQLNGGNGDLLEQIPTRLKPTGPKSMRDGVSRPRDRRMLGHLAKAMDRSSDSVLHKVRSHSGNERINSHTRAPPTGPRQQQTQNRGGRGSMNMNGGRNGSMAGPHMAQNPMMNNFNNMSPQATIEMLASLQQQMQFMAGVPMGNGMANGFGQQPQPRRSLADRIQPNPRAQQNGFRGRGGSLETIRTPTRTNLTREPPSADATCKYNLSCTNKDCKFAHQSPAAPPGAAIDVSDVCTFGAACKNRKCTGRHPSPAQKIAHQTEMDCKYFPNCTNARCPFRHPTMPLCRNGADCTTPDCKFTHSKVACKFNPCLNAACVYKHEEGQKRGKFEDKVWVANGAKDHVSERKFIDENGEEELIKPGTSQEMHSQESSGTAESRCTGNETQAHVTPSGGTTRAHKSDLATNNQTDNKDDDVTRIAVLGGGITGLASAHYLARELPHAKITLYEASDRVGGWLRTTELGGEEGEVYFEQGPRTLRPGNAFGCAGLTTLELIQDLGLENELLITPKNAASALNRFVYYPDHLVKMPGPGQGILEMCWRIFSEPVFKDVIRSFATELIHPRRQMLEDESVGSFLNRRFETSSVSDNLVSAVLHGIYAGDVYNLSVKSLLPAAWHLEGAYGSIVNGLVQLNQKKARIIMHRDLQLASELLRKKLNRSLVQSMGNASVYTFKKGISTLSAALVDRLKANPNVKFELNTKVDALEHNVESDKIMIEVSGHDTPYDRVISTISGRTLSTLSSTGSRSTETAIEAQKTTSLPSLASIRAVTVMVVNLFYANPSLLPTQGFGYLIPRSIPLKQNPEMALGVIFDSDATVGLDSMAGTKLTVILGGHWWDGYEHYPSEEEGTDMARAVIKRHLKVEDEPVLSRAKLQRDCIPQYSVGHEARMKKGAYGVAECFWVQVGGGGE
ncbi:Protoporphyrinogen oxidase [Lachnellula subtilissima]|uniref:protoporphyrinogen oxidase n=1 Tax=Lachnellula subtilissima TaxID=602034 RepID=A0A8H8RCA7_9HELO|nr:Protoporphyrinogen oxidase [Lachnellula subtilissima]